jgi:hypothetical protein
MRHKEMGVGMVHIDKSPLDLAKRALRRLEKERGQMGVCGHLLSKVFETALLLETCEG